MKTNMTVAESTRVLGRNGFYGYFGPGYTTLNAVDDFMARYPRGKGIKGHQQDLLTLYEACYVYKRDRSRSLNYSKHSG